MSIVKLTIALSLALTMFENVSGQGHFEYSTAAEQQFTLALKAFRGGQFAESLPIFDSLAQQKPTHQRTTAAYIMAAKALFQLTKYRESASFLITMLKSFPESDYIDDARYTLGLNYMMVQWNEEAALQFIRSIEITGNFEMTRKASALFESLADDRLSLDALRHLSFQATQVTTKDIVSLKMAEKMYAGGDTKASDEIIDGVLRREVPSNFVDRFRLLKARTRGKSQLKIGVMLPLMEKEFQSSWRSLAGDMLDGIQYSLRRYQNQFSTKEDISIEVRDADKDSLAALHVMKEFCDSRDVIGVIGPLFSSIAMICAPIAETCGLPLISPTATSNGIAAIGHHVFQESPDLVTRGKVMARYAVQQLGLTSFAILAPAEPMGKALAESFSTEVKSLGGLIVVSVSYEKGASDLSEQFLAIRWAGLLPDSQAIVPNDYSAPVTSIQGIFVPISDAEEINIVAPQLTYFNIKAQLLGTAEWYDPEHLDAQKRYLNGTIFISDSYSDRGDPAYAEFDASFFSEKKKHPSKYTLLGYDTMQLILEQMKSGATTRERLTEGLSRVTGFPGIHSKVSFTNARVNSELIVLKYLNGEIVKVTGVSLN